MSPPVAWTPLKAAHLLRRAGFAPTPVDVAKAWKAGFEKTVLDLLKPDVKPGKPPKKALEDVTYLQAWWVKRMITTQHPLTEKLLVFWHNHFATANSKVDDLQAMHNHIATLRTYALTDMRSLLLAVSMDPAMLKWLDNKSNYVGNINENYARELMELFTTGVLDESGTANYTETDVTEVARAFTGWSTHDGQFLFKADKHDEGDKTVKGVTGNLDGTDVIDILVNDPATARRIPMKLFSYFAYPITLQDPICDDLQAVYVASNGSIPAILDAIFRHDGFWSPQAERAIVKAPVQYLVGSLRMLNGKVHGKGWDVGQTLQRLGQALYNPPSVFGWKEGLPWVGTSGLLERAKTAEWIADARGKKHPVHYDPKKVLGPAKEWKDMTAANVVARVLQALDVQTVSAPTSAALLAYAQADSEGNPQTVVVDKDYVDLKVRGLIALVMSIPEYMMA